MLANYHTHTTFSDGKNTPEEVVRYAIENGFSAVGFSDHGYTDYDKRYCMKDTAGYIAEIKRLKEKYADKIEIYLGVEEDSHSVLDRGDFDYIIGSCHYLFANGAYYPIDSNYEYFKKAFAAAGNDELAFAKAYYGHFCEYIRARKPDLIGHFDLITKFDEKERSRFLDNEAYWGIAEKATLEALQSDCIFEVNTGMITRGFRSAPCPHERLLRIIQQHGGKVALSSDSHQRETLNGCFAETEELLRKVGFSERYILKNGRWTSVPL